MTTGSTCTKCPNTTAPGDSLCSACFRASIGAAVQQDSVGSRGGAGGNDGPGGTLAGNAAPLVASPRDPADSPPSPPRGAADNIAAVIGPAAGGDYPAFLAAKQRTAPMAGIPDPPPLSSGLFPWQALVTRWALRRGKAALFLDTGLGKTRQILEWARVVTEHTDRPVLILAPLAVSHQFVREAEKLYAGQLRRDARVKVVTGQWEIDESEKALEESTADETVLYITNYQKLHRFDPRAFGGIALDESSIIKHEDGATRNTLIESFAMTPYRLCATATPSPNDHTELGNTAEFLGIMKRTEMLAEFFVHDGGNTQSWRLKGHAIDAFFTWVASWAVAVKKPSDLGFADAGYDLPPLRYHHHCIAVSREEALARGSLFIEPAAGLMEQRQARRASLTQRVAKAADIARAYAAEGFQVTVWCDLNDEQDALADALGSKAFSVQGRDSDDEKELAIKQWLAGKRPVMISKGAVMGWGLNLQNASKTIFVGASNSFEMHYQCVRRQWRFGQTQPVDVHMVYSEAEGRVLENLERKQAAAEDMGAEMSSRVSAILREELTKESSRMQNDYDPKVPMTIPGWL